MPCTRIATQYGQVLQLKYSNSHRLEKKWYQCISTQQEASQNLYEGHTLDTPAPRGLLLVSKLNQGIEVLLEH